MIKFVLPFSTVVSDSSKDKDFYLCAYCKQNKINWIGEDKGCSLNERVPGDTVKECKFFKRA